MPVTWMATSVVPPVRAAISRVESGITRAGERRERLARDLAVVERERPVGELLALLVSLAGDDDDVARRGAGHGTLDRPRGGRARPPSRSPQ